MGRGLRSPSQESNAFSVAYRKVVVRQRPSLDAPVIEILDHGDTVEADEVLGDWIRLGKGSPVKNGSKSLRDVGYALKKHPEFGELLTPVAFTEQPPKGELARKEIQAILQQYPGFSQPLPLEAKLWSKNQLELFLMSGGVVRPRNCSISQEDVAKVEMSNADIDASLLEAATWISGADAVLIGSGAGMGVDSGLATFRGMHSNVWPGLGRVGLAYEDICEASWFEREPRLAWSFWNHCHKVYRDAGPHNGYNIVRKWADCAPLGAFTFTSNIDGHWKASGWPSDTIVEVHGTVSWMQCSKRCSDDVWKTPADLNLIEDPVTCRVRGDLPCCKKCGVVARPYVQMFNGDSGFATKSRRARQIRAYDAWLRGLEARADKKSLQVVCIEIGCGVTVPTVRKEFEAVLRRFPSARLVRINPENAALNSAVCNIGASLPLAAGDALSRLNQEVVQDEATYLIFSMNDEGQGVEITANRRTSAAQILVRARQKGVTFQGDVELQAICGREVDATQVLGADETVPEAFWVKDTATLVLLGEAKFPECTALEERVTWVKSMLDDIDVVLADGVQSAYQDFISLKAQRSADYPAVAKLVQRLRKPLVQHGFPPSAAGLLQMERTVRQVMLHPDVKRWLDFNVRFKPAVAESISVPGHLQFDPSADVQTNAMEEQRRREETCSVSLSAPLMQVKLVKFGTPGDKDADLLSIGVPASCVVSKLRTQLSLHCGFMQSQARKLRFVIRVNGALTALKDAETVRQSMLIQGVDVWPPCKA